MVPLTEIGPPVNPVPVEIDVTVPVTVDDSVTVPVPDDTEIPAPAMMLVTPELEMVTLPVEPEILMPVPARIEVTPLAPPEKEITPFWSTVIPAPTTKGL
jgi:hypothetical protein